MKLHLRTKGGVAIATFNATGVGNPPAIVRWQMRSFLHVKTTIEGGIYHETECLDIPEHWRQAP